MRPKRTAPEKRPLKRPVQRPVQGATPAKQEPRQRSQFGDGVLAEAQADAAHGAYMWSSVQGKFAMLISAVGYGVYHLFTAS